MSRYLNKLNVGMIICEGIKQTNGGEISEMTGITRHIKLNSDDKATFTLVCDANFVEFEIPEDGGALSFRLYIRTLGATPGYRIPFMVMEIGLHENNEGVMTCNVPMVIPVKDFKFPTKGQYAIEIYKYFGTIDLKMEENNRDYYRIKENFVNAIIVTVE